MNSTQALAFWLRALREEFGWAIPCPGGVPALRKAQKILYDARKQSNDPRLQGIMMCLPGSGKEIWLVKKDVELDQ